jgi:hypothetical protein
VDFADLIYVRSQYYLTMNRQRGKEPSPEKPMLFGEKEGKIAWANRRKDPLYLFCGPPAPARLSPRSATGAGRPDAAADSAIVAADRPPGDSLKLMEDEQRKGRSTLPKFYQRPDNSRRFPEEDRGR